MMQAGWFGLAQASAGTGWLIGGVIVAVLILRHLIIEILGGGDERR